MYMTIRALFCEKETKILLQLLKFLLSNRTVLLKKYFILHFSNNKKIYLKTDNILALLIMQLKEFGIIICLDYIFIFFYFFFILDFCQPAFLLLTFLVCQYFFFKPIHFRVQLNFSCQCNLCLPNWVFSIFSNFSIF